jgi:hypothetical protein
MFGRWFLWRRDTLHGQQSSKPLSCNVIAFHYMVLAQVLTNYQKGCNAGRAGISLPANGPLQRSGRSGPFLFLRLNLHSLPESCIN